MAVSDASSCDRALAASSFAAEGDGAAAMAQRPASDDLSAARRDCTCGDVWSAGASAAAVAHISAANNRDLMAR